MKQRWLGGHIHIEKDGRPLFIIERQVRGHRFHISTRCNTERGALAQLARFEADPFNYRPEGEAPDEPLYLTPDLIEEYEQWSMAPEPRGAGNTPHYARSTSVYLGQWGDALKGVDLRKATLREHYDPALQGWETARGHRIIAIKAFHSWLRQTKRVLTLAQDPTADLLVPQGNPEKWKRRKAVDWAVAKKAFRKLPQDYRDVMQLLAGVGWHVTELERFIRNKGSSIEKPPRRIIGKQGKPILAVLITPKKAGGETRTPLIMRGHVEAARRLRARGTVPRRLNATLKAACEAAGVPPFTFGVLRHSVGTWAVELGASKEEASEYLGHASKVTSERFYFDVLVPTTDVPTRVL